MSEATITGDEAVQKLMRGLRERVNDVTPAWPAVGDRIAGQTRAALNAQVSPAGRPWSPLSPKYLAYKTRNGFDPRIWHKTGAVRDDLTSRPMKIEEYAPQEARFGTDRRSDRGAPYPVFVQRGTVNMPARPLLFWTDELVRDTTAILQKYVRWNRVS